MHIAILLAGHTNKAMPQCFHDYNDMFSDLFASLPIGKNFRFTTLAVVDDVFPAQIDDYDGYLVSGSAYGVYDDAPFIPKLMDFLRQIYAAKSRWRAFVLAIRSLRMRLAVMPANGIRAGVLVSRNWP